ncbi:MAG TPA: hypothetical protein VKE22_17580 [Haliangiales bacterium]|nr:hypothetical protein [Haliangiales bacterium]
MKTMTECSATELTAVGGGNCYGIAIRWDGKIVACLGLSDN